MPSAITAAPFAPPADGAAAAAPPSARDLETPAPLPAPAPGAPAATATLSGAKAHFDRTSRTGRDVIELSDGKLTVDARRTTPAEIRVGTTAIRIADAKATVTARTGVLASVAVFAGSVELSLRARSTVVRAKPTSDPNRSLAIFRDGWLALRQNRFAAAIAAFDRASDPVVQEDAAYWAAVAAYRAGNRDAARRRFTDFLARFPESPRVDAVRRALDV
jgi:TolA-binding protein